jgi:hypothetical protein
MRTLFPGNNKFAFAIFDDTDRSTVSNSSQVYSLLSSLNIKVTKSVWILPPRAKFKGSQSLDDRDYLDWIKLLHSQGHEIGLHNVGDGRFTRAEIYEAFELFQRSLGFYPRIHSNHVSNPDNIYWWHKRFSLGVYQLVYKILYLVRHGKQPANQGEVKVSPLFWGDMCKDKIDYVRNFTFNSINTLSCDPLMPWHDQSKPFVNFWFSSSDASNVIRFNRLLSPRNIRLLRRQHGACIAYTHFANGFQTGKKLNPRFQASIEYLASFGDCWFPSVSELLDFLHHKREYTDPAANLFVSPPYLYSLETRWLLDRLLSYILYRK